MTRRETRCFFLTRHLLVSLSPRQLVYDSHMQLTFLPLSPSLSSPTRNLKYIIIMICLISSWICRISRAPARLHSLLVIVPHSSTLLYHFRQAYHTTFVKPCFCQPAGNQFIITFSVFPTFPIHPIHPHFPPFPRVPTIQKNLAQVGFSTPKGATFWINSPRCQKYKDLFLDLSNFSRSDSNPSPSLKNKLA